jgi:DNA-binding XRE family transcriptional regulator
MSARRGSTDLNDFLAGFQGDSEYEAEVKAIRPITNLAINTNRLRNAARMSQNDLARAAGTTQPAISKIERAEANLRLTTVARLAAALGVEASDLLADPPVPAPVAAHRVRLAR